MAYSRFSVWLDPVAMAKYLGVWIGPRGRNTSWEMPIQTYLEAVKHITSLQLGFAPAVYSYNMRAFGLGS